MPSDISFSGASTPLNNVNTAFLTCTITPAPSVEFDSGASGVGHDANPSAGDGAQSAIISGGATLLAFTAGSYVGGAGSSSGDAAAPAVVSSVDAQVNFNGGTFTGLSGISGFSPACGMVLHDPQSGAWYLGTATGGNAESGSGRQGGTGAFISCLTADYTIAGASCTGGAGDGAGPQGFALTFAIASGRMLTVSGGVFSGIVAGNITAGGTIRVYTGAGFVPTKLDGSSFSATTGVGYTDYT